MQTVRLFRRRRESLVEHDGDQSADAIGDGLVVEVIQVRRGIHEGLRKGEHGGHMGVDHGFGFVAGQVAQLDGEVVAAVSVVARGGEEGLDVFGGEFDGILARGPEIEEFQTVCLVVVEEVCPVGVCLHVSEFCDLA